MVGGPGNDPGGPKQQIYSLPRLLSGLPARCLWFVFHSDEGVCIHLHPHLLIHDESL